MNFRELVKKQIIVLDGAMGTMLQANGLQLGEHPESFNITHPEIIKKIHSEYIQSGSNIIYTNTFGASEKKLASGGLNIEEVIFKAIEIAKSASNGKALVAYDMGPLGELIEPLGTLKFDEAYEQFATQVKLAKKYGADLIVVETMTSLYESKIAVLAAKENCDLPVVCTMSFEENGRTFSGTSIASMALTLDGLGVDALGINCSLGATQIIPLAKELAKWTNLPLVVKANAGLPNPDGTTFTVSKEEFIESYQTLVENGVSIIGGCCGTTPKYIKGLSQIANNNKLPKLRNNEFCAVCSNENAVIIDSPKVIGERINPTGKKLLKQALIEGNTDYVLSQAISQCEAGAHILDVNAGLPEINEVEILPALVKKIQAVVSAPLQIDTSNPLAIEKALRIYNGKAIVNSVNGDDEVLDKVLPLVKKYGGAVIGLTLNKNGIPKDAKGRVDIAKYILKKALSFGIKKQDVIIDCLTLTVSAEQSQAVQTLDAIKQIKNELGLKTVLGVSNISFGLPMRENINTAFLTLALANGLDLAIINPNIESNMQAIFSFNALCDNDKNCKDYIERYTNMQIQTQAVKTQNATEQINLQQNALPLLRPILHGLKNDCKNLTIELLKTLEPLDVINNHLIVALDEIGKLYETQKIFLPQLIQSAETAKVGFDEVKLQIAKTNNGTQTSKGKIVLATVKGDIHDIGKNIVKVVLENYGYQIIDLGKNVPVETVVEAIKQHNVKLVGLSALMTTTVASMAETIKAIKNNNLPCKIFVGGAVLTKEYAQKIGADFFAEDANKSTQIAKSVLG